MFQLSHTTTKIVMPIRNPDVPIPRANASENRPKRSLRGLRRALQHAAAPPRGVEGHLA